MSMCEPFDVEIDGMPVKQKREMEYLIKTFWLKSVYDIFLWKLCYGIVPYFEKTIDGTAHRCPMVPEIFQGTLFVYEDDDRSKVKTKQKNTQRNYLVFFNFSLLANARREKLKNRSSNGNGTTPFSWGKNA